MRLLKSNSRTCVKGYLPALAAVLCLLCGPASAQTVYAPANVYPGDTLYAGLSLTDPEGTPYTLESVRLGTTDLDHEVQCRRLLKPMGLVVVLTCSKDSSGKYAATVPDEMTVSAQVPALAPAAYTLTLTLKVNGASRALTRTVTVRARPAAYPAPPPITGTAVPGLALWETTMTSLGNKWCPGVNQMDFGNYNQVWYYDGARAYFQMADYTGNASWENCALNIARQYRDYVLKWNGNVPDWAVYPHGLRMAYQRSGDTSFRDAVLRLSTQAAKAQFVLGGDDEAVREIAYIVNAHVEAERLGAGRHPHLAKRVDYLLGYFDRVFAQGSYPIHQTVTDALAAEALIYYYELTNDSRVPAAIQSMLDWTWDLGWNKTTNKLVFNPEPYGAKCREKCLEYFTEWVNLTAPAFAWYWNLTGNSLYQFRGDELFRHALDTDISSTGKLFSQNYKWSFEYVRWRKATRTDGACQYVITPSTGSIGAAGGTLTFQIAAGSTCPWVAFSNTAWAQITGNANGSGAGSVSVQVSQNSGTSPRTATITIAEQPISLTQAAGTNWLSIVGGTPQTTVAGTSFAAALQVRVLDPSSNPVSGVTVTFTAPGSGASALFNGSATAAAVTNASGTAASPVPVANANTGSYSVTASAPGLTPVTFSLSNTAPPISLTLTPKNATVGPSQQQTFTAAVTGTANTAVTWSLSPNLGSMSGNTYTAPPNVSAWTMVTLTATSQANTAIKDTATIMLRPADSTIFSSAMAPGSCTGNGSGTELGVKFRSDIAGQIRGIRFYKAPGDTSTHTGSLWSATGTRLAHGNFTNETSFGWQQMVFATPVMIAANTTYVASYHSKGIYCATYFWFWNQGTDSPPLHALRDDVDGPNGVFTANPNGGAAFPFSPNGASNYWVDVLFVTSPPSLPGSLSVVSGTPQTAVAGASFGAALQVQVLDTASSPMAGVTVTFTAPSSGAGATFNGSTSATAVTNASGIAVSPVPVANATTGGYSVTASVAGLSPVQFSLTNTAPPPPASVAAAAGTPQTATVGTAFGAALQARVADAANNPVTGVTVTFTAPSSGATATFSGSTTATATTNAAGIATSPVPVANSTTGTYAVTAAVSGLTPASFSLTNSAVPAISVAVSPKTVSLGPSAQQVFTVTVTGTSNTAVTWSLSPNVGTMAGNTYIAPASITTWQSVTATATSQANNTVKDSAVITLAPPDATIFAPGLAPGTCYGAGTGTELGVKFRSDTSGVIRGIRFYKSPTDTSSHTGSLWSAAGALLATGTFTNETSSGWQQMVFATPVPITANTTYVASYFTRGSYCSTYFWFWNGGTSNPPLHALQDDVEGPNGVYASSPNGGVFPNQPNAASNYWVDVLFAAALPPSPASIAAAGGTPQSATVSTAFGAALQARVLSSASAPVAGVTVTFTAPGSGASATFNGSTTATAVTNASGIATSPVPLANATSGAYTVTASVSGLTPAQFSLTNTAALPAASVAAFSGTPQTAVVGTSFGAALQARVLNSASNPVAGVTVTFTAPSSGAGAAFNGSATATAVTNASGIATSPVPVANSSTGTYAVTAGVSGLTPASFSLTNSAAPSITVTVSPKTVSLSASGQQVFTATVTGTANTAVIWSLSPAIGTMSGSTYTAPSAVASVQTITLTATSQANNAVKDTATITLRPADATLFPPGMAPMGCYGAGWGNEMGVKFRSDIAGFIRGVRFYKAAGDTGTHTGSLWTGTGTRLASGTFTNETPSGWQTLLFAAPVPIAANTTYVASYFAPGPYCTSYFWFWVDEMYNPPLRALKDDADGPNGVWAATTVGGVAFPNQGYGASNHWVDVLFTTAP